MTGVQDGNAAREIEILDADIPGPTIFRPLGEVRESGHAARNGVGSQSVIGDCISDSPVKEPIRLHDFW